MNKDDKKYLADWCRACLSTWEDGIVNESAIERFTLVSELIQGYWWRELKTREKEKAKKK